MASAWKSSDRSKRDAVRKLAEHRLSVLELTKELGKAKARRRRGLDWTRCYEWKRRFRT